MGRSQCLQFGNFVLLCILNVPTVQQCYTMPGVANVCKASQWVSEHMSLGVQVQMCFRAYVSGSTGTISFVFGKYSCCARTFICLSVWNRRDNSKNIDPIITKLGQYMHPGPGHKPIVFGVSRSKVKVTKVKFHFFHWFHKNRHNFLNIGRRDSNKIPKCSGRWALQS